MIQWSEANVRLSLCNEVVRERSFQAQCDLAAALGYDGLEVAPFTLSDNPQSLSAGERKALRKAAADAGVQISGLHWLLVAPEGLSLNGPDAEARQRTQAVMTGLIELCADLGGDVLVHGSPVQRNVAAGEDPQTAWVRARDAWAAIAPLAEQAGVVYCIEALAPSETNFINTIEEAVRMVGEIGSPAVRTMIDTCAASKAETDRLTTLIDRWLPQGVIGHVQLNDANLRAPGQGEVRFTPVLAALQWHEYGGWLAIEPFFYQPDGPTTAAYGAGYVRGVLEALAVDKSEKRDVATIAYEGDRQ